VINRNIIGSAAFATIGGATYVVLEAWGDNVGVGCAKGAGDLVTLKLDPAAKSKVTSMWCASNQGKGSPIITTTDGQTDALVWTAGAETTERLHAWDLVTGTPVALGGDAASDVMAALRRFTTVIVVHGRIFVGADRRLWAFKTTP
jgi:hypothetical protein